MPDQLSRDERSALMSKVRTRGTGPELAVRAVLASLGVSFRTNVGSLPGQPDIVAFEHRVAIFVHGCFWHQHKGCGRSQLPKRNLEFWSTKLLRNVQRGRRQVQDLRRAGWRVAIVWECQTGSVRLRTIRSRLKRLLVMPRRP